MAKLATHKSSKNLFTLGFKKVRHSLIIGIALLVSGLITLPRVLSLFDIVDRLSDSFTTASVKDILIRFIFLFIFSWLVLQYNTNWKYAFSNRSKFLRISLTLFLNATLFFSAVNLFVSIYDCITGIVMLNNEIGLLYFVYFVVLFILVFVSRILRFQIIHQEDIVEKELLKQQSLLNELEALKNQINPHFLFNSLNSLNSLIRDNKPATTFVNKLSFMYRYILQSRSQDLVTIEEELKFLESYIYLINTRYRDRFKIEISIDSEFMTEKIPALALQLLVENAVKHNEISESNPLLVKVYYEKNAIVVENVIRLRTTFVDSTGNGLVNLDKRYMMLKNQNIIISNAENIFKVKLPLN